MRASSFKQWLARVALLTERQREQLLSVLQPAIGLDRVCAAIEENRRVSSCPDCGARRIHRHGHVRGLQRYRCCACGRTFSALSGTPLARLRHRVKWLDYLEHMLDGRSVRKSADALGVHRNTSFRWRHRFLHLAKDDRPPALAGIAEADELFLLESQKGSRQLDRPPRKRGGVASRRGINREHVCVLVARDQHADVFAVDAAPAGHAAALAWRTVQLARALLRFEQEQFVGFGDAGQGWRTVVLGQVQEAVAPAEAGVAVHPERIGAFAHRPAVEHMFQVVQPFDTVAQPGQGRAAQGAEGASTGAAAVALQAADMAVPMNAPSAAIRTGGNAPVFLDRCTDAIQPDSRLQD